MNYLDNLLKEFISIIKKSSILQEILSIIVGGSYITGEINRNSDLDLLIVCEKERSSQIFFYLQTHIKEQRLVEKLDVKILELNQISQINNSFYSPFFYHFVLNSEIILGKDLRDSFRLDNHWKFQVLHKCLKDLDLVKELVFSYYKPKKAEILLYETSKRICILHKLRSRNTNNLNVNTMLHTIFGKKVSGIKKNIRNQQSWITLMQKTNKNEISFLQKFKCKKGKIVNYNSEYIDFITTTTERISVLGNQCLGDLSIQQDSI